MFLIVLTWQSDFQHIQREFATMMDSDLDPINDFSFIESDICLFQFPLINLQTNPSLHEINSTPIFSSMFAMKTA